MSKKQSKVQSSALSLILAAERLIARHGVEGVSLRQINEAAGVRNASAVQYHFGSREDLLMAVFDYRMTVLNERRQDLLKNIERKGNIDNQRELIGALVRPIAGELVPRSEGNFYIRFLERCTRENVTKSKGLYNHKLTSGWMDVQVNIKNSIDNIPDNILKIRMQIIGVHIVAELSALEANLEYGEVSLAALPLHVEMIIDSSLAILVSPISSETLHCMSEIKSNG